MTHLGDILDIDLATGAGTRRPFDEAAARSILGGRGFGVLELWRSTGPGTDPLSPSNPLILAPGLLTGTGAPTASRLQVTARSPLTGLLGSSNVGGGFGFALHAAGLAALVLHGTAPRFSWLSLSPSGVELHDARDLVGLETFETQAAIAAQLPGPHGEALVIGPAGERLLPLACLVSQRGHAAGRTGWVRYWAPRTSRPSPSPPPARRRRCARATSPASPAGTCGRSSRPTGSTTSTATAAPSASSGATSAVSSPSATSRPAASTARPASRVWPCTSSSSSAPGAVTAPSSARPTCASRPPAGTSRPPAPTSSASGP
ncbi:MAG: hypothetical protein EHM52_03770, partial [Actinomycetota bacterium]